NFACGLLVGSNAYVVASAIRRATRESSRSIAVWRPLADRNWLVHRKHWRGVTWRHLHQLVQEIAFLVRERSRCDCLPNFWGIRRSLGYIVRRCRCCRNNGLGAGLLGAVDHTPFFEHAGDDNPRSNDCDGGCEWRFVGA